MRIIGGTRRGKRLHTPKNNTIRPTADRVRESIFNIGAKWIPGAHVLDLFAGTGAMGLEALSREASSCVFIDNQPAALALIKKNILACNWTDRSHIIRWDLRHNLKCLHSWKQPFSLVFIDPPYQSRAIPNILHHLDESSVMAPNSNVIVEHTAGDTIDLPPTRFKLDDQRTYGKTLVSFFRFML